MDKKLVLAFSLIMVLAISSVDAQITSGRHQKTNISQRIRSGDITRFEGKRLAREQYRIRQHRRRAKLKDGHIGPREGSMLAFEQRKASRHAYHLKHNRFERS